MKLFAENLHWTDWTMQQQENSISILIDNFQFIFRFRLKNKKYFFQKNFPQRCLQLLNKNIDWKGFFKFKCWLLGLQISRKEFNSILQKIIWFGSTLAFGMFDVSFPESIFCIYKSIRGQRGRNECSISNTRTIWRQQQWPSDRSKCL